MSRPLILLGLLLLAAPAYGQGVFPVNQWSQYGTGAWDQAIWRVGENGAAYPYDKLLQGDGSLVTMRPNGITLGAYRGQRGGQDAPWHAWWSGVWDSTRKRYLAIMGSGDQNESSNEVNEWDWALGIWNPNGRPVNPTTRLIVPNTVDWPSAYLYDPSKPGGPPAVIDLNNDYPNNVKTAQNGQKLYPLGRQTYGGIVYMPSVRRVWLWGGFGDWNPTGGPYLMVEYDPATQKYEVITTADGNEFGGGAFHGTLYPTATWDATNNRVLFLNSDGLWSYTPTAAYGSRTACLVGNCDGSPYQTRNGHTPTLLWDSKRQWLVAIGGDAVFDATKLVRWDFSGGLTNPSVTQVPITGTFALALGPEGPGALYDPVGDRYVVWAGGTTLYYINPDTAASTPFTPSAGSDPSAVTDTGGYGLGPGVWSRFWYIAGDDVYATLNFGTQQGVFVFKPSRAGSVPVLSSLSPASALQGGPAFTLTVTGANFVSGSVVQWNGSPRTTTFVSATQLTASIPASDLTAAGFASVKVFNPGPGGGASNALTFTITAVNPVPTLTSLAPSSALQGGPAFTLTVTGTNFIAASVVQWNGSPRTTIFVSATQLTASIPASDLTTAGSASVTVVNPAPGGGASNALTFTITPALTVTSVAPNQGAQGAVVPVTITGTGFAAGASVSVSGSGVTASNVAVASSTQITVTLTIAAKAPTNARKVTVTNSKGASAALMGGFTVTAP